MLLAFLLKNLGHVTLKEVTHTCIKNILEYAQILATGGKFMIFYIEGHSNSI